MQKSVIFKNGLKLAGINLNPSGKFHTAMGRLLRSSESSWGICMQSMCISGGDPVMLTPLAAEAAQIPSFDIELMTTHVFL